jgi:hypothetical protein
MMIDTMHEQLVGLVEATQLLPRRRGGRQVHPATIYSWTTRGCRSVVLESTQVGGTRCTSKEALSRFFERLAQAAKTGRSHTHMSSRQHSKIATEKKLDQLGL